MEVSNELVNSISVKIDFSILSELVCETNQNQNQQKNTQHLPPPKKKQKNLHQNKTKNKQKIPTKPEKVHSFILFGSQRNRMILCLCSLNLLKCKHSPIVVYNVPMSL